MDLRSRKKVKTGKASSSNLSNDNVPQSLRDEEPIPNNTEVARPKLPDSAGKTKQQTNKQRKPKLQVMELPIDVMIEIYKNLHPRELCALVRTCKGMRDFLLKRNIEKTVWETVCKNADDLPPRPEDMSLPAFVHFLYAPCCHFCGAPARKVHQPAWFARCCSACLSKVTYNHTKAQVLVTGAARIFGISGDVHDMCSMYVSPKIKLPPSGRILDTHAHHVYFMKNEVDALTAAIESIARKKLGMVSKIAAAREELARARKTCEARKVLGSRFAAWFAQQENHRSAALDVKREQRFAAILEKLREEGWDKEVDRLGKTDLELLANMPVVRRSTKLTQSEWLQVIQVDEVMELLEETRAVRLEEERVDLVAARLSVLEQALSLHYGLKGRLSFLGVAKRCKLITDAPASRVLITDDFLKVLPGIVADLKTDIVKEVVRVLRRYTATIPKGTKKPLDLAVVIFKCRFCPDGSACMRFEDALFHECNPCPLPHDVIAKRLIEGHETVEGQVKSASQNLLWGSYTRWALEPMRKIVAALGLDFRRATAADLAACEGRLRCTECVKLGRPDTVYTWEAAMDHDYCNENCRVPVHPSRAPTAWEAVSVTDLVRIRELEAEAHILSLDSPGVWACSLCEDLDGSGAEMKEHLKNKHDIADHYQCVLDGRVHLHPTKSSPIVRPPVTLPSRRTSEGADGDALPEVAVSG